MRSPPHIVPEMYVCMPLGKVRINYMLTTANNT